MKPLYIAKVAATLVAVFCAGRWSVSLECDLACEAARGARAQDVVLFTHASHAVANPFANEYHARAFTLANNIATPRRAARSARMERLVRSAAFARKELVLCVGQGSTGTRSLASTLKDRFNMSSVHYHKWETGAKQHHNVTEALVAPHARVYAPQSWLTLHPTEQLRTRGAQALADALARFADGLLRVDAAIDTPVPQYFEELLDIFPRAKVILTVRDPHKWVNSVRCRRARAAAAAASLTAALRHCQRLLHGSAEVAPFPSFCTPPPDAATGNASPQVCASRFNELDAAERAEMFVLANWRVLLRVPRERLLIMDITSEPPEALLTRLARFLGKPVPRKLVVAHDGTTDRVKKL